ncbi:M55 family metallopeptidase [Pelagibacterium nitratireducens]|uniref:M55 family metallopeptidase n=1 Tax=Pelagibacterium nitratireducens TaxID=1046114 RepID=A0ABZ2I5Y8_9HYPH
MKVFVSVDMEGMAGVTHSDHTKMQGPEYEMARVWMTEEANAVVEGALEAGATDVVVADAHGFMHNILPHKLHRAAQLVSGIPRPLLQMEGIDESFAAAIMIGFHARAGDAIGVLSHTHVGRLAYEVRINGEAVDEITFNTAVAGHFGVPLALVAADDRTVGPLKHTHPWVEFVTTKWAISRFAARSLSPLMAQDAIREGTMRALRRLDEMKVVHVADPIEFEMHFFDPMSAQLASDIPGAERIDGRGIRYVGKDMLEITRIWRLSINAALSSFPL